ncbi:MAG: binding-protein-dependent transport system inner rane component [Microbacteriaceae bacterium]|nr:binding-protein-dependent transport system inner rane component [Microbacteriaceae bacterium]
MALPLITTTDLRANPGTAPSSGRRGLRRIARAGETPERGVISNADRKRLSVRIPLITVQVLIFVGLVVAGFGPLVWLFKAAISTTQDTLREPFALFPSGVVQWGNLAAAWTQSQIGHYLGNTGIIAVGQLVATLIVCTTIAYVLSVLRPKWGPVLSGAILATLFVPGIVILVPLYLTILHLPGTGGSLLNSYWAIWLPGAANAFNILVIKRFFDAIPRELFEAARIDGAGPMRVFLLVVIPLSRPILGVVALLTVMASWKDYLWPLLVLQDPDIQPISVALPRVAKTSEVSIQMAALFLALLIPVILFLIFQRQFLRGVGMSGGVKG